MFVKYLLKTLPTLGKDVVLLRVFSEGTKNSKRYNLEYNMIDYYDNKNNVTAMMRTTAYPVSIIAQMIERGVIKDFGVFCSEEVVPCEFFFEELKKRDIKIEKKMNELC